MKRRACVLIHAETRLIWVFFEVFFAVFSQYFFCPPIGKKNSSIELHSIFTVFFAVFPPNFRDTIRLSQRWEVTFAQKLTNKQQYQHNKHSNVSSSIILYQYFVVVSVFAKYSSPSASPQSDPDRTAPIRLGEASNESSDKAECCLADDADLYPSFHDFFTALQGAEGGWERVDTGGNPPSTISSPHCKVRKEGGNVLTLGEMTAMLLKQAKVDERKERMSTICRQHFLL